MFIRTTSLTNVELKTAIVREPLVVSPDTTVIEAIALMSGVGLVCNTNKKEESKIDDIHAKARSSCVLVVENEQLIGLLTERDVVRLSAQQQPLDSLTMRQVMAEPVVTLRESAFTDLFFAINLLKQHRIRHLPILDRQDRLVGLVTHESLSYTAPEIDFLGLRKAQQEKLIADLATQIRSSLSLQTILNTAVDQQLEEELREKRQIEARLRDSEQRYTTLATVAPVGIFRTDIHGNCTYINDRYCQIAGLTLEAIIGRGWQQVIYPEDRNAVIAQWQEFVADRLPFSIEYRFQKPDGKITWVYGQSVPERDINGIKIGYVGTITDISDRKRAENRLQQSEERYATLVEAAPVGIFRTDAMGACVYVNDRWCQISGLNPKSALGEGWRQGLHPEDETAIAAEWEQSAQENRPFQLEYRFQRPDGVVTWVYGQSVAELDGNGQVVGYIGTVTDISDRKQTEAALIESESQSRAILAAIPDFMFRLGADGIYRGFVTNNREIDIVSKDFDPTGLAMIDVLPLEIANRNLSYMKRTLETGEMQVYEQQVQVRDRLQDEEVRVVKCSEDEVLFMIRDISDRKQAERALHNLIEGTAATTGQDFFPALVNHVTQALNVTTALVTELKDGKLHSLGIHAHGSLQPNVSYDKVNSVCKSTLDNGIFYCEKSIQTLFPQNQFLADIKAESYLGIALKRSNGEAIGSLCILNSKPLSNPQQVENLLRVFAARATAELERQQANALLEQLNQELEIKIQLRTQELSQVNSLQRAILDGANYAIISTDMTGTIQTFNAGAELMLGYSADEIIGKVTPALIHDVNEVIERSVSLSVELGQDISPGFEVFVAKARQGIVNEEEWTYIRKDGSRFPVSLSISSLKDVNQEIIGFLGIGKDISDSKRAAAELQKVSNRLALSLKSGAIGCWEFDMIQNVMIWDNRMYELYGVTKESDFQLNYDTWINSLHPDDRAITQALGQQALSGEREYDTEFRVVHPDGSIHFIKAFGVVIRDDRGNPQSITGINFDISDRKQAELERQKLIQELSTFKQALDHSALVAITDAKGVITYTNDLFSLVSGYSREELIGQTHQIINSGYHPPSFFHDLWRTISRGEIWRGEICNLAKNGSLYWISSTIVPFLDEGGIPFQYLAIRFDITARKLAEAAMQQENSFRQQILENMAEGLCVFHKIEEFPFVRFTVWNQKMQEITGYTFEEINRLGWYQSLYPNPEDREEAIANFQRMPQGEKLSAQERKIYRQDGEKRVISVSSSVLSTNNDVTYILALIQDITERKETEQAMTQQLAAIEAAIDGIAIMRDESYLYLNQAHLDLFGYENVEELVGKSWKLLYSSEELERFEQEVFPALIRDRAWQGEAIAIRKDGSTFAEGLSLTLTDDGLIICVCHDISDRKQAELALQSSEIRFRRVFHSSVVGMIFADFNGSIIDANDRFLEMIGYTREELNAGMIHWDKMTPSEYVAADFVAMDFLMQHGVIDPWEKEYYRKDGSRVAVLIGAALLPDSNNQTICVIVDITERKRAEIALQTSEQKFRRVFTSNVVGMMFSDLNGNIFDANERFLEIIGYTKEDINVGINCQDLNPPEYIAQAEEAKEVLNLYGVVQSLEKEYYRKDGSRVSILMGIAVLSETDGICVGVIVDISDRKQAEKALQESQQFLQTVLDTIPLPLFWKNQASVFLGCNHQLANSLELKSTTEIIGKTDFDLSTTETQALTYRLSDRRVMESGEGKLGIEETLILPTGEQRWIETHKAPLRDWEGNVIGVVGMFQDITDRKQTELRLQQQAEQERLLSSITQRMRSSLNLDEILNGTIEELHQVLQSDRVLVYRVFPGGTGVTIAESALPNWIKLLDIVFPEETFPQDNYDRYLQGRIFTLSDRENEHQLVLPCLVEFLAEIQVRAKLVVPIVQNQKLWGLLIAHQCDRPRVWEEWEINLMKQTANQLAIAIQQSNLFQQLQTELAERQRAESRLTETNAQLAISNQELARATRLKDEFLANMSHELRTPLNAILGMTEGLQEEVFGIINESQIKALQTIERSGSHLLELINDILDVAKIEAGQMELDCSLVSINHLCQSSLAFIKQQAIKKRIQLEMKIPLNLPNLLIDERRIRQVLINLLNNAVKFTPEGGRITIEVTHQKREIFLTSPPLQGITKVSVYQTALNQGLGINPPPEGVEIKNYLRIAVIDTGIGIAPEDIKKLFQPFIQIDSALNRQYAGTGLGLALVKRIVELHGGEVGLTSKVGFGSSFTIDLPCGAIITSKPGGSSPDIPDIKSQEVIAIESNQPTQKLSPLILLAEDNEANISTVSSYLKAKGYRLILAKDGEEAIARAISDCPNLILMDISMPGMDGLEAMKEIRRIPNLVDVPIIALTALAMTGDRDRCIAAGANDYMTKPVKLKQLVATIQQFLLPIKNNP